MSLAVKSLSDPAAAWVEPGSWPVDVAGQGVTAQWLAGVLPEDYAAHGLAVAEIAETQAPTGPGVRVIGDSLVDVEGVPTRAWLTESVDLDTLRAQAKAQARAIYEERRQSPMAWSFGSTPARDDDDVSLGVAGDQTLQMRQTAEANDLQNWTAVAVAAVAAVAGGSPNLILPIKATSNAWIQTKASELVAVLVAGDGVQVPAFRRGAAMLKAFGAVKLAIDAAADAEAIAAVDLSAGYPN